ncbi:unnamed protein product [Brachionus calyciflorus]|uniref:Uncharacterized protein n=1 Tax=Brachionus calyciflorus TaxID=104777 RepID=A0A813TA39_9BILA|nr:unnamed protein product [Brachionus calyciflorus]
MKILIFFYILIIVFEINQCLNILIETSKNSGNFTKVELREFVRTGFEQMSVVYNSTRILDKGVMVLGLSGTGKSTLVNYLNNIPLMCIKSKSKWILELKDPNVTLPGGFKIGHTDKFETQYPAVYTPNDRDFTYIDSPGFKDNRGIIAEIANDLNLRGDQFRDTIRAFSDFLGVFDDRDTKDLAKSTLTLVSRVEHDDETDEEMIEIFKDKLEEILNNTKISGFFRNISEELVFREIIKNNQIAPRKKIILDNKQSQKILSQIDTLKYIKRKDVKARVRIQESFIPKLLSYTENLYVKFLDDYQVQMKKYLEIFFDNLIENVQNVQDMILICNKLNKIKLLGTEINDFETFVNNLGKQDLLTKKAQFSQLIEQKQLVDYLVQLLPDEIRNSLKLKKNWIYENLLEQINNYFSQLLILGEEEFKNFLLYFERKLLRQQSNHESELDLILQNQIFSSKFREDILGRKNNLNDFFSHTNNTNSKFKRDWLSSVSIDNKIKIIIDFIEKYTQTKSNSFENFLDKYLMNIVTDYYSREIINSKYLNDLDKIKETLDQLELGSNSFINLTNSVNGLILTDSDKQKLFDISKLLIEKDQIKIYQFELLKRVDELKKELFEYEQRVLINDDLTSLKYYGHFVNMSSVMTILKDIQFNDLKLISIFATHSFMFDQDFYLNRLKYVQNFPDLIIIAPFINFSKQTLIDLSCLSVPDYPDGKPKASNGNPNGDNGKPDLVGFNGGNLYILADEIKNLDLLNFKSSGGQGGPGQNGGDGAEGKIGSVADASKITFEKNQIIKTRKFNHKITVVYYGLDGESGTQGGNAGQGGIGGIGGLGGKAFISDKVINKTLVQENGRLGKNGEPGKAGLGGFYGNVKFRGRFLIEANKREILSTRYDYEWPSQKRGFSGLIPQNFNEINRTYPIATPIIKSYIVEYTDFMKEADNHFKYSDIFNRKFVKNLN